MPHRQREGRPSAAPDVPLLVGVGYTVPCRECGTRLSVTEDELAASLVQSPVCWPCSQSGEGDVSATG